MKVLLTGAAGFIGRNFLQRALSESDIEILAYHHTQGNEELRKLVHSCEAVVHLAGVNRPPAESEFAEGNVEFTNELVTILHDEGKSCPIIFSSSRQAEIDNPYGFSKRQAEEALTRYAKTCKAQIYIYRLPNVFGKWARPDYNSVVATFCYHLARHESIHIASQERLLELVYIDDVVSEFLAALRGNAHRDGAFYKVPVTHECTVGQLAKLLQGFVKCQRNLCVPDMEKALVKKLYSTYISYLPPDGLSYELSSHEDERGSFTEFIRTAGQGQFSVNVSKPHVRKGGHWHQSKHEKFLVVAGQGRIRLRQVEERKIYSYDVSAKKLEVIEIPPGYTHDIENLGETDMVTIMWANENFDPSQPDTYRLEV